MAVGIFWRLWQDDNFGYNMFRSLWPVENMWDSWFYSVERCGVSRFAAFFYGNKMSRTASSSWSPVSPQSSSLSRQSPSSSPHLFFFLVIAIFIVSLVFIIICGLILILILSCFTPGHIECPGPPQHGCTSPLYKGEPSWSSALVQAVVHSLNSIWDVVCPPFSQLAQVQLQEGKKEKEQDRARKLFLWETNITMGGAIYTCSCKYKYVNLLHLLLIYWTIIICLKNYLNV